MHVSVIIPSFNGRSLLEKNLPSVFTALQDDDEVIIVDDASRDDTLSWMQSTYSLIHDECIPNQTTGEPPHDLLCFSGVQKKRKIQVLVNQSNQRFGVSCNLGVQASHHEIILLLNNDVSPTPGFLQPLLSHFNESRVFGVGCKEIASAEGNREYGRSTAWFERGFYVHKRSDDQNGSDTAWVAGGSGAFRRSMWMELHGFDPDFKPAYGEDIDLSFRAQQRGWKTLFEPRSVVFHNHESTNASVFGQRNIEIMSFKNACLFMWKTAPLGEKIQHLFWLPYHLVFTTARSKGAFLQGFWLAVQTFFGIL